MLLRVLVRAGVLVASLAVSSVLVFAFLAALPGDPARIGLGVKELLEKRGSDLAESEIVFPTEEFTADCTGQITPPDLERVNEAWQEVLTG